MVQKEDGGEMTKQEEIENGVASMVFTGDAEKSIALAKRILVWQSSQGCVLKVEGELEYGDCDAHGTICNLTCHNMERKLIKEAGYCLTKPIKEG